MHETAGTEPRHTNGNPAVTNNAGAGKPEDPKNEGDRATPHYVYRSGRRKRQAAEAPSHRTSVDTKARRTAQQEPTCHILPEVLKRTGTLQHSTNEEENNERKKKYVSQYIRKNKKCKEFATRESRVGYTTRSGRGRRTAGHAEKRATRIPTSTRSKRKEVRAN